MNNDHSRINSWIENRLLPELRSVFGKDNGTGVKYSMTIPQAFFMSEVFSLSVTFLDDNRKLDLFVKTPQANGKIRRLLNQDPLFRNEIHFYRNYLSYNFNLPRCYYTANTNDFVIVMENVVATGYDSCPKKINIDMEYTLAAIKEIGKYHANGYIFKEKSPDKFFDFCKCIEETRFQPAEGDTFREVVNTTGIRPILNLRKRNYDGKICKKIEDIFENVFDNVLLKCYNHVGPLATVCHGDFTVNNVFFKRNSRTGALIAKLVDFATLMYASPAIDVSTFLYLSCSPKEMQEHFVDIFKAYYDSILQYLVDAKISDLGRFSYEAFYEDYKKHALFGYVVSVFFFPVMAENMQTAFLSETLDPKILGEKHLNTGGEAVSDRFGDFLINAIERGLLDNFKN